MTLPPVAALVTAEAVAVLPARLRGRLDAAVTQALGWTAVRAGDKVTVRPADNITVTLAVPVREAGDATCSCLLSPRCLHRAAVLSAAPVLIDDGPSLSNPDNDVAEASNDTSVGPVPPEPAVVEKPDERRGSSSSGSVSVPSAPGEAAPNGDAALAGRVAPSGDGALAGRVAPVGDAGLAGDGALTGPGVPSGDAVLAGRVAPSGDVVPSGLADSLDVSTGSRAEGASGVSRAQREAAAALWAVAAEVLAAGIAGAGAVAQAELLRAAHQGRVTGLHTAAAAAVRVVEQLRAARRDDPAFHRAELTADLRELLVTCRRVDRGDPSAVGVARRDYQPVGDLRLFGVFSEPVRAATGHAGAVTYLADAQARVWAVSDVKPADPAVALTATRASVDLGEVRLSHHDLARGGLRAVNAHAAASGRLSHGRQRQAITAPGASWFDSPLEALWQQPLADQVDRWLAASTQPPHERAHAHDLAFLAGVILGADRRGLLLALEQPSASGLTVAVGVPHEDPALPYVGNLRLLAAHAVGQRVRMIARFTGPGRVEALAVTARWLPEGYGGHIDLGAQRLTRADVPGPTDVPGLTGEPGPARVAGPTGVAGPAGVAGADESPGVPVERPLPPLHLVRHQLERVVAAGRAALLSGVDNDVRRLAAAHLGTASTVVAALGVAGVRRTRDVFGRLDRHDAQLLAEAWLTAAIYEQAATTEVTRRAWKPATAGPDHP